MRASELGVSSAQSRLEVSSTYISGEIQQVLNIKTCLFSLRGVQEVRGKEGGEVSLHTVKQVQMEHTAQHSRQAGVHWPKFASNGLPECLADNPVRVSLSKGLDQVLLLQHPGVEDAFLLQLVPDGFQDAWHLLAHLGVDHRTGHLLPQLRVEQVLSCLKEVLEVLHLQVGINCCATTLF